MSDRQRLEATIVAIDKASATLKQIATGAEKMGTSVEQAGQKGGRSLDDLNKRMAALGAVVTTGAALLGQWSRSSQEAQAIQRQLEASITATGESFDRYAARIDEAGKRAVQLGQDDEAASQAIAALTQITGSANTALDEMGLVFDLAAAKGLSLESAAELVGRVMEGNVGILQRYGIVVEDGATATEALAQIQQQVAGQAEAHATTYARLREELSNLTDRIGDAVDGFAPMLALLPGVSSGFTLAGSAAGALAPNLTKAAAASAALDLALGPVGIVLAAGAAAFAIYELTKGTDDYAEVAGKARQASADLATTLNQLAAAGSPKAVIGEADLEILKSAVAQMGDLKTAEDALAEAEERLDKARKSQGGDQAQREAAIAQLEQQVANTQRVVDALKDVPDAMQAIGDVLADTGTGAGLAQEAMAKLFADFAKTGDIVALVEGLSAINDNLGVFDDAANEAAVGAGGLRDALNGLPLDKSASLIDRLTGKIKGAGDAADGSAPKVDALGDAIKAATDSFRPEILDPNREGSTGRLARDIEAIGNAVGTAGDVARQRAVAAGDAFAAGTISLAEYEQQLHDLAAPLIATTETVDALTDAQDRQAYAQETLSQNMADAAAQAEATRQAIGHYTQALGVLDTLAKQLRPLDLAPRGGDRATGTAALLQQTGGALDSVLGLFGQIDQMGQRADQTGSVAERLIGTKDEVGTAIGLLDEGRISRTRYNQTIEAGNAILGRQTEIEKDLEVVRAKQLPFLDQADADYAKLIDKVSHLSAEEQVVTLGFMDSNEAMRAQEALALAASAAQGELGESGKAAATQIIEGAIAADPVLGAMLESIGLVARDHEGNLVVNFPEGESLNDLVKGLTESIDALTTALGGVPPDVHTDVSVSGADDAIADANSLAQALNAIPTVVNSTVTTTKQTVVIGEPGGRDGGVVGYADGGVVAEFAEVGPERLRFRNGGTAIVSERGLYAVPRGTFVTPAAATAASRDGGGLTLNLHVDTVNGFGDLDAFFAAAAQAARAHFAGMGVG